VVGAGVHGSLHVGILLGIVIGATGGFVFSYAVIRALIGFVMLINGKPLFRRRRRKTDDSA